MDGHKALKNVKIYHLLQGPEKAPMYLMKLVMTRRKSCFKLLKGIAPETKYGHKVGPFLRTANSKTLFHKEGKCCGGGGGGIQDFYDTYVLCKYDSRKGKAHSNLEVPKSKIIQEDKGIFARCPVLI